MASDGAKLEEAAQMLESMAKEAHAAADQPAATDRLRAFEDKFLGKDVPRVDGKIERGHGSKFGRMTPNCQIAHTMLERLVAAEDRVTTATAELAQAKAAHAEASTRATHAESIE